MHERGRGGRGGRDASGEAQVPQQQVQLRDQRGADEAHEREDTEPPAGRVRDHREDRQAGVADGVRGAPDLDAVHVGKSRWVEREVAVALVVVADVEVAVVQQALRDEQVVRLVRRGRHHRAVVREQHEHGDEADAGELERYRAVAHAVQRGPQRGERVDGEADGEQQVDRAELPVQHTRPAEVREEHQRERDEVQPEVARENARSPFRCERARDEQRPERGEPEREGKPLPEQALGDRIRAEPDPRLECRDHDPADREDVDHKEESEFAASRRRGSDGTLLKGAHLRARSRPPCSEPHECRGSGQGRKQGQVGDHVPVRHHRLERRQPGQWIEPEHSADRVADLVVEGRVQRERRDRAQDHGGQGAHPDQHACDAALEPAARGDEAVRDEGRPQRQDVDEVARGRRVPALPQPEEREREDARTDREGRWQQPRAIRTQRGSEPEQADEDPGRAAGEPERAVEEDRGQRHPHQRRDRRLAGDLLRLRRAERVPRVRDRQAVEGDVDRDRDERDRPGGHGRAHANERIPQQQRQQDEERDRIAWRQEQRQREQRGGERGATHRCREADAVRRRDQRGADDVRVDVRRQERERGARARDRPRPSGRARPRREQVAEDQQRLIARPCGNEREDDPGADTPGERPARHEQQRQRVALDRPRPHGRRGHVGRFIRR